MTTEAEPRTSAAIGGMGHSVKRKEDPRFIRGQGEYIDDVNLPGQLWLDIVRSPYAHATISSIEDRPIWRQSDCMPPDSSWNTPVVRPELSRA